MRVNFASVWVGDKYGPEYVEILRNMVLRNCSTMEHEQAFWCITDRPNELPEGVIPIPAPSWLPGWWAKCALFSPNMPWERGDRCVYFDLDVAITGRLEDLVETPGIIRDFHWPCFNSSVMVWDHGDHPEIWEKLTPERLTRPASLTLAPLLPKGEINGGDQEHITEVSRWSTFPQEWCVSYRDAKLWPPNGSKVVVLHGHPKNHEVTDGWLPNVWKLGGYTSLPELKGVNTTEDFRLANIRANVTRELDWFTPFKGDGKRAVIVGGAPSMKDHIADIRWHARQGARIVSVNNAWRFLVENGVIPDVHVMLDARQENVEFVRGAPKSTRYVIASQCHPDVFDALAEREVVLWHNAFGDSKELWDILQPYMETKPIVLVPGGCTVGLRSLWLCAMSGFRTIHVYGMDSSYDGDTHHAYAQPLNDGEQILDVVMGDKPYRCAKWMIRQATEFRETWHDLRGFQAYPGAPVTPVTIHVHGRGLLPDIAASLKAELRAAA